MKSIKRLWFVFGDEMELDQVLKERKSVRRFKKLDVPWYLITECLEAATLAPNSGNVQNWRFIVVRNPQNRDVVIKCCEEQYWMLHAPVLLVVCSDLTKIRRLFSIRGEALYSVQNCAAAMENLILKAHELGLGSTWIGAFDETKINAALNITGDVRAQAIIALGYSDEIEEKAKREPLDNVVSFEHYGQRQDTTRGVYPVVDKVSKHVNDFVSKLKK